MEYQYQIQCRVEALAHIAMSSNSKPSCFCSDGISFSHWDKELFRDDTFWLAKVIIKAENLNDAITCFNKKMTKLIPPIAFISQCYIEFACQPFLIKRMDKDFAFVRYVCEDEAVGLMFGEKEEKALVILLKNNEIPKAFYSYWNDAVNTIGYSSKLLLLCSALDALGKVGLSRGDKKYKEKFYKKIEVVIGQELKEKLWGTKQDPNSGLRQRLVHGDYLVQDDVERNYVELVQEKIVKYFNESIFKETLLAEDVVEPQRHILGNKKAYQNFIKPSKNKPVDLQEILSALNEDGIEKLEEYEWVDDEELTANY